MRWKKLLDESILNLHIALLVLAGTIIFILVSIKRKDLRIYLPTYLIFPIGEVFIYLQVYDSIYRLIGNIIFMISLFLLIGAIFYEYYSLSKQSHRSIPDKVQLSVFAVMLGVIQTIFIVLIIVVIYLAFKLYLRTQKAKYLALLSFFGITLITVIATFLSNFNMGGAWELSYLMNILLGAIYFAFPIIVYLAEKIIILTEKYQLITENANDLIALLNNNYEYEYINEKAYLSILGYSKLDLIGKKVWDLIHPEDIQHLVTSREISTNNLDALQGVDKAEIRIKHKREYYVWLEYTSKIFEDNEGFSKVIIISREITEKKEAERIIKEENKKLMEIDSLRTELITRISHELKTPLTSMFGATQILIQSDRNDTIENILPYLGIAYRGSVRLKELVDNLIDTAKLEEQKFELRRSVENIIEILNECIEDLKFVANNRKLAILTDFPDELYFNVDKLRFSEVITNIISNAIKNTPPNGKIFITTSETENSLDIIVKDTGVGITGAEKKMLFQKFGKIERYGKNLDIDIEGVGIGLYISKEIMELHGGEILADSEGKNKGSTFTIRLQKKQ
ncbi:MAG: ATP-binding protein [Promethearchaeota archaeon]